MITKLTAENNELYQARFALMNQAFEKKGVALRIASLEEYFANIETIFNFAQANPEYKGRCLMMAVDEPLFEIDANSRVITIPAEFKKNGIAVIGDHLAETVYFKIDKYFDYQSFYKLITDDDKGEILINWTFTPAGSKAVGELNSSVAFGPSDDLVPGYLIFGWTINKDMTAGAGTLTFSVQFRYVSDGEIVYSFNTLPASISVGQSLTLKDPTPVIDKYANSLGLRLKNSAYRVDAIEGPDTPEWILDLPAKISMPFEGNRQTTLVLPAQAGIQKGVTIRYKWTALIDGETSSLVLDAENRYLETEDTEPVEGKLYYKAVTGGYELLVSDAKTEAFAALGTDDAIAIYELYSVIEVNKAGHYSVQALAEVDISSSTFNGLSPEDLAQLRALTKSISSNKDGADNNAGYCLVPVASTPEVTLSVSSNLDPASYEIIDPEQNNFTYISDDVNNSNSAPSITATVSGEDLGALAVVMLDAEGKIVGSDSDVVFDTLTDNDIANGEYNFVRYNGDIAVSNDLTAQGQYKVGIINRLNNTYAKGESDSITTSFVAPAVKEISVYAVLEGSSEPVKVLDRGVPAGEDIDLSAASAFTMVDNNLPYTNYPDCVLKYYLQEVDKDTLELVEEADPAEVEISPAAMFMPADYGYYRIKTVADYNNTRRVGYTGLFRCTI